MVVRDYMSVPVVTVTPETSFQDALALLRQRKIRRLPVVDKAGSLVGIITERDLLHAAPSPATSLSVWELNYLLWQLQVEGLMTRKVLAVQPDTPLQDAAQLMLEHKIGGLPVVDNHHQVVGVITETDIFRVFVKLLTT
jgi:acetoin utilization protein AcuB